MIISRGGQDAAIFIDLFRRAWSGVLLGLAEKGGGPVTDSTAPT
jgi:hypothetical protein